jgi:hypothetical protein
LDSHFVIQKVEAEQSMLYANYKAKCDAWFDEHRDKIDELAVHFIFSCMEEMEYQKSRECPAFLKWPEEYGRMEEIMVTILNSLEMDYWRDYNDWSKDEWVGKPNVVAFFNAFKILRNDLPTIIRALVTKVGL